MALIWAAVICVARAQETAAGDVRAVQVRSSWGGLGKPQDVQWTWTRAGAVFRSGGQQVGGDAVADLLAAAGEPAMPEIDVDNLGLTAAVLSTNADGPRGEIQGGALMSAANQRQMYRRRFEDRDLVRQLLISQYTESFHTDDYPCVSVRIEFENGTARTLSSTSQQPFMLPWKVDGGAHPEVTYNADISRALVAFMPKNDVNRERIGGAGLLRILHGRVWSALEPELNELDAENRAGAAVAALKTRYVVGEAEINAFHHPEYGTEWSGNEKHEVNLHVTLTRAELPRALSFALVLGFNDGRAEGADKFLAAAPALENSVMSVPWLADYLRENESDRIRISYVHDDSLGDKAWRTLSADLHKLGKDSVLAEIGQERHRMILLIAGEQDSESYWLLFPDRRMLLWRYGGPSGLLKWTPNDFNNSDCSAYGPPRGGCVGAFVSAAGELAK